MQSPNKPVVCGHRGAMAVRPENTMASFSMAIERGATWVEFDVRPSADVELVIHHDPVTADGLHIADVDYRRLDPTIPLFQHLATGLPELGLDIEMKTDGIGISLDAFADLVVSEIAEHCAATSNLMVTSFDAEALALVRDRQPNLATGLLFHNKSPSWAIHTATEAGHTAIAPWITLLSPSLVEQARDASLEIATWTVNKPAQITKAIELGVDMIIGDDPAAIVAQLQG